VFVPSPPAAPVPQAASTVTFAALGNVIANADATPSIVRIDVTNPNVSPSAMRPLRLIVNAGGSIRMCDPSLAASDARGCPAFP
jgi:type IV fimbrial biogenesis protein FimT